MIKLFCDKCGEEEKHDDFFHIVATRKQTETDSFQFCYNCWQGNPLPTGGACASPSSPNYLSDDERAFADNCEKGLLYQTQYKYFIPEQIGRASCRERV